MSVGEFDTSVSQVSRLMRDDYLRHRVQYGEFDNSLLYSSDLDPYNTKNYTKNCHLGMEVTRFFPNSVFYDVPAATIALQHEFYEEDPDRTVLPTLSMLESAAEYSGPLNVLIWANSRISRDKLLKDEPPLIREYFERYDQLVDGIEKTVQDPELLRVTASRRFVEPPKCANESRSDQMEGIIGEALVRRFQSSHPVIWLDSDMSFIGRRAISNLIRAVESDEAHFFHANMLFSGHDPEAAPFVQRSIEEKIAALYALTRRVIERSLGPNETRLYVPEPGLAMRLDTYMKAGGVGLTGPAEGESKSLLRRAAQQLDGSKPLVRYVDSARIGSSYRYIRELAATHEPRELPDLEQGPDYTGFIGLLQEGGAGRKRRDSVYVEEIMLMVDYMADCQAERSGLDARSILPDKQRQRLGRIASRWLIAA